MAAAQQHQFDGLSIAVVISAAQQHQIEFDGLTPAKVEKMEEIWRHRGEVISEAEELLREKKSWMNLMTRLFFLFLGVCYVVVGATSDVTRADRIAIGITSCMLFVIGVGLICWDAYLRAQIEHFLAFMQSVSDAFDLESAG